MAGKLGSGVGEGGGDRDASHLAPVCESAVSIILVKCSFFKSIAARIMNRRVLKLYRLSSGNR
jgi:hypothetical protein